MASQRAPRAGGGQQSRGTRGRTGALWGLMFGFHSPPVQLLPSSPLPLPPSVTHPKPLSASSCPLSPPPCLWPTLPHWTGRGQYEVMHGGVGSGPLQEGSGRPPALRVKPFGPTGLSCFEGAGKGWVVGTVVRCACLVPAAWLPPALLSGLTGCSVRRGSGNQSKRPYVRGSTLRASRPPPCLGCLLKLGPPAIMPLSPPPPARSGE